MIAVVSSSTSSPTSNIRRGLVVKEYGTVVFKYFCENNFEYFHLHAFVVVFIFDPTGDLTGTQSTYE